MKWHLIPFPYVNFIMHKFFSFIRQFSIPKKQVLRGALASFSSKQLALFVGVLIVALISVLIILNKINESFMVSVPASGGTITEGIVGMPTLVNPVLALSDADKDLTSLVYSGLMRRMSDGSLIPDLAQSYTASADGMTYTFIIKQNAKFHDGKKVTADDVIFTIEKIKDPLVKSPRKTGWDSVSVDKKDADTVVFTLKQPFISFLDNTTIGILPEHIWKNVTPAEFGLSTLNNINAIGSGPYLISSVLKNKDGVPENYKLKRFNGFTLGSPHIRNLNIVSYANEKDLLKDLKDHSIDQAGGISPENAKLLGDKEFNIKTATLPRIFGLFFNSGANKIFADTNVIHAFDKALNRQEIIDQVLGGYATAIHNPIPETIIHDTKSDIYKNAYLEEARAILDKGGWTIGEDGIRVKGGTTTKTVTKKVGKKTVTEKVTVNNGPVTRLSFSITTGDTPELKKSVELIKEQLEKIGAEVDIQKIYETGPLNQMIRTREYEALFFGQVVNHESDLFSFWHSSQKVDPGLNIAMYSSATADKILETAQKTLDRSSRVAKYEEFAKEFDKNVPALLIYSPRYIYVTREDLGNIELETINTPSDRFTSLYTWYAEVDQVWEIFNK